MSRGLSSAAWGRIGNTDHPPDPDIRARFLRPEGGTLNLSGAHAGGCAPLRVEGAGRAQAEQMARERADTVLVLDCQSCGALTPGERFRYFADQIICEACDERNPQSRRRLVPGALLQPRDICVNFVDNKGLGVQAMALDCRTMLGPQLRIQSADTLRRLLAYLGATPDQLADFDSSHRRWGQGTVQITLQPCRKNLLRIDYQRL